MTLNCLNFEFSRNFALFRRFESTHCCGVFNLIQWCSSKFGAGERSWVWRRSKARGRGVRGDDEAPEAKSFFVFGYSKKGAIFHLTSKFRKPHIGISSDVGLTGHSDSH